jgi:hypothetical protein
MKKCPEKEHQKKVTAEPGCADNFNFPDTQREGTKVDEEEEDDENMMNNKLGWTQKSDDEQDQED